MTSSYDWNLQKKTLTQNVTWQF